MTKMTVLTHASKEEEQRTAEAQDTFDIKCAWLVSLQNMALSLSRLRASSVTLSAHKRQTVNQSQSLIELMLEVEAQIGTLQSKLMATWDINHVGLMRWLDLELEEYRKRTDPSRYTVSRSDNSRIGQTKKSHKR